MRVSPALAPLTGPLSPPAIISLPPSPSSPGTITPRQQLLAEDETMSDGGPDHVEEVEDSQLPLSAFFASNNLLSPRSALQLCLSFIEDSFFHGQVVKAEERIQILGEDAQGGCSFSVGVLGAPPSWTDAQHAGRWHERVPIGRDEITGTFGGWKRTGRRIRNIMAAKLSGGERQWAKTMVGCGNGVLDRTAEIEGNAGSHGVVQFRPLRFRVDVETVNHARRVYATETVVVPEMRELGVLNLGETASPGRNDGVGEKGEEVLVQVAWFERVLGCISAEKMITSERMTAVSDTGGEAEERADCLLLQRRHRLVQDLADMFARSWESAAAAATATTTVKKEWRFLGCGFGRAIREEACRGRVGSTVRERLVWLEKLLPCPRLRRVAGTARRRVERGDLDGWPVVLTHGDLLPSNLLVDEMTGELRAIIDWAEAEMLPFGVALYGLDLLLVGRGEEAEKDDDKKFVWHPQAAELRAAFWHRLQLQVPSLRRRKMQRQIQLARVVGILLWFGIAWDDGLINRVVTLTEDAEQLKYLHAFLELEYEVGDGVVL